jgi:hypothetical protein
MSVFSPAGVDPSMVGQMNAPISPAAQQSLQNMRLQMLAKQLMARQQQPGQPQQPVGQQPMQMPAQLPVMGGQ